MDKLRVDYIIAGGLLGLTLIAGVAMSSVVVTADDAVDVINITVPTACTMGGTIVQGEEHSTSLQPGTYESGIGKTTLTTYCNDPGGFGIYAIGFTGDAYTGTNHTKLVGNTATNTISTGLTTGSSTTDASSWAMKLSAVTGAYAPTVMDGTNGSEDFTDYHVVPDTFTKVATYGNTTDAEGGTGSSLETTYAVYASLSQPADTYTGKVKYTLVHPATEPAPAIPQSTESGKIKYYANASDAVGTMGQQDVASSITLLASNFSRAGYGFAGWSNKHDYATNTDSDLKFYGPMETITLNTADYTDSNPGLSLYAVWVKSQGSLQDSSKVASVCNSLTPAPIDGTANLSSVSALTDQRDNNTYAIAKLADGKCWMIENLRLDNTNDDNSTGALAQGYGTSTTYGDFKGLAETESPIFPHSSVANSLYYSGTQEGTASINLGVDDSPSARFPRYNNTNVISRSSNPATNNVNIYSYGNYYTWHAAIADLSYYGVQNQSAVNTSICPAGWRLPIGGQTTVNTSGEFYYLGKAIMSNQEPNQDTASGYGYYDNIITNAYGKGANLAFRSYPNNFLKAGLINNNSINHQGTYSTYWTSTVNGDEDAYYLFISNTTGVYPGTRVYNKNDGRSIRCLMNS